MGSSILLNNAVFWRAGSSAGVTFTLEASDDVTFASGVTNAGTFTSITPAPSPYAAEQFAFVSAVQAQYIRMTISAVPGQNIVGFGEIAFRTADIAGVPEPASFALGALGLLGVYLRKGLR